VEPQPSIGCARAPDALAVPARTLCNIRERLRMTSRNDTTVRRLCSNSDQAVCPAFRYGSCGYQKPGNCCCCCCCGAAAGRLADDDAGASRPPPDRSLISVTLSVRGDVAERSNAAVCQGCRRSEDRPEIARFWPDSAFEAGRRWVPDDGRGTAFGHTPGRSNHQSRRGGPPPMAP
jgi:hypothetical protein